MNRLKRLLICGLCISVMSQTAFATRYMQSRQKEEEAPEVQTENEDVSAKIPFNDDQDWGNMYYTEELPGTNTDLFKGYTFDGKQIETPEFDKYDSFKAEEITNFSDAIVDYRGWDAALGATSCNVEEKSIDFKVSSSTLATEKTFGYGIRMFGCEAYEFDFKIEGAGENWSDGFIGFSLLASLTQAPSWQTGVGGYLVLFRGTNYEFQRYVSGQEIVKTDETNVMTPDVWHRVKIDLQKDGDKKMVTTSVDGNEIFTYTDEQGSEIADEGYFNILCYAGTKLSLRAVNPTISQSGGTHTSAADNTIALKIGSGKAIRNGAVTAVDENNEAVAPYIEADRTLVPLRFISESLGAYVTYEEENKRAILAFDECNMEFTEGFAEYKLDDDWYVSECPVSVIYDRMFVPARVIAEAVGKKAEWADGYVFISDKELTAEEKTQLIDLLN